METMNKMVEERRIGKFRLPYDMVFNKSEMVQPALNRMIVLCRCHILNTDELAYTAFSPLFDSILSCDKVPTYTLQITGTIVSQISKEKENGM